jgi:N-acetylglucosamine-6-phosphate deacetylase
VAVFLTGAAILQGCDWLRGHGLLIESGRIVDVLPDSAPPPAPVRRLPPGSLLAPGLIDIQVNGGGGLLFNESPLPERARAIAAAHRRLGTTSILPTLITDSRAVFAAALDEAACSPGVIGLHLEGPFLSQARPGVHKAEFVRAPDEDDVRRLKAVAARLGGPVLLTVAPETVPDGVLRRLSAAGIRLSAGHTAAPFDRVAAAIEAGLTGFTHLFNAMPPPAAREPGPVAAALLHGGTWCGVIADGIHVAPAMLRLLQAARGLSRIILVSDAMPPAGTDMERFDLQGRDIFRRNGRLETADGILAGADICLMDAVRRASLFWDIPLSQALLLATANPADYLGLSGERGRIAPGLAADLLLLNQDAAVLGTWLAGVWQGCVAGARSGARRG